MNFLNNLENICFGRDLIWHREAYQCLKCHKRNMSEKLCLRWNDFEENVKSAFVNFRGESDFSDVTLACTDGQHIEAHKVILAASSPFLAGLLKRKKHPHPIIYMRGIKYQGLVAIVDFLYHGEANVYQDDLDSFLSIAEEFQLKGLMGGTDDAKVRSETKQNEVITDDGRTKNEDPTYSIPERYEPESNVVATKSENTVAIPNYLSEYLDKKVKSMMTKSQNMLPNGNRKADVCKVCGKEGYGSQIVKHIEANHLEGLVIPCNYCEKTFRSRNALGQHKLTYHK